MVSFSSVQTSNSRVSSILPAHLVAVFVGATSGIGELSLKAFAKDARQPRIYFVGRSQESADRIKAECKALNAEGEYHFIKADTSLIRNVDDVCREIQSKEKSINLLFMSQGTLMFGTSMQIFPYSKNPFPYYLPQKPQRVFTMPWPWESMVATASFSSSFPNSN
jgi:NAD(P)-dependent dehydrogenase (short-subunit alcohol dehydrogenase family)